MGVKLRTEKLANGRKSILLDVYIDQDNCYQKRLKMYLHPEKSQADKSRNKEVWKLAELIRNEHESDILNQRFGKQDPRKKYNNCFLAYFDETVKHRYETGVNYDTWYSVQKHLITFSKNKLKFDDITESWLESFKAYLISRLSQNSAHTYFNKVKRAVHSAFRDRILENDPAMHVSSPKMVNTKREYLTEEELHRLKNQECRYPILKSAFFFSVLTGLRWSDVHNLKWGNVREIDEKCELAYTQKKTKETESLPINQEARNIIGERKGDDERVFKGLKYSAWHNVALSQWMIKADIKKHITFHCARHTHATLLINKGVELFTVSKLLGHKDLRTTQLYAKIMNETKVNAVGQLPSIFGG